MFKFELVTTNYLSVILRNCDVQIEINEIEVTRTVALAEWLRRVPAKYMGFPRESSNLSGDVFLFFLHPLLITNTTKALSLSLSILAQPFTFLGSYFSLSSSFFTLLCLLSCLIIKVKTFNQVSTNFNQRLDLSLSLSLSLCYVMLCASFYLTLLQFVIQFQILFTFLVYYNHFSYSSQDSHYCFMLLQSLFSLFFFFNFHYIILESHTPFKTQKGNKFRVSDIHMVYAFSDARIRFSVKSPFGLDINFD